MQARLATLVLPLLAASLDAQLDNRWLEVTASGGSLDVAPDFSTFDDEVDLATGDLDGDGWVDVVVARKQPFGTTGKRANVLLLNEQGVLRDVTAALAATSDVPGDLGFLTPTNDRDVVLVDVDADGDLDVVTATTLSAGDPKHLSHPRVYVNLDPSGGAWPGVAHEDARIPELFHFTSGLPVTPRFTAVAAGDLDADGLPDLYFGDGDDPEGGEPPAHEDCEDRLLRNAGAGFFVDDSLVVMSPSMLDSEMCPDADLVDINGDGAVDLLKNHGYGTTDLNIAYGDTASAGNFDGLQKVIDGKPYGFDVGDLNNDGRLDLAVASFGPDLTKYNLADGVDGQIVWSDNVFLDYYDLGDDGASTNTLIGDLDLDGWNDVFICDVGIGLPGFSERRSHLFHNPGGAVGSEIQLIEERETDQEPPVGWVGAVGLTEPTLQDTYDVALIDIDNDGDLDLFLGQATGPVVHLNQTVRNAMIADTATISLGTGGAQAWTLDAGTDHAGELYLVLGSFTGTTPGFAIDGVTIPLNWDGWFTTTLNQAGQPPLIGTLGFLDANGTSAASLTLPAGTNPLLAGATLHHAMVTVDVGTLTVTSASTPAALFLEP